MTYKPSSSPPAALVEIDLRNGQTPGARATIRLPGSNDIDPRPAPVVLVLPGFKGFREWGFFPFISEVLAGAGFASIAIDFSHNGIGDDPMVFSRLDLFEQNCLRFELADTRAILEVVAPLARIDATRLGLLGHSRGGALALLCAGDVGADAIACWAPVATWSDRFTPDALDDWQRCGRLPVMNGRTGQLMHIGRAMLEEVTDRGQRFEPRRALSELDVPLLLVHGTEDQAVPLEHSRSLERIALARPAADVELVEIVGTGHTFGARHPFTGSDEPLDNALRATTEFFRRSLC